MEADHPYLIKVSTALSEFTVEGVDIVTGADEDGLVYIQKDEYTYGSRPKTTVYDSFIGTYVANTPIPEYGIFISNNQFISSVGKSFVNAFRGYFEFNVTFIDPTNAGGVKYNITIDDNPTAIENIDIVANPEGIFDMSGRKLNDMPKTKGVYVIDGKKVAVK